MHSGARGCMFTSLISPFQRLTARRCDKRQIDRDRARERGDTSGMAHGENSRNGGGGAGTFARFSLKCTFFLPLCPSVGGVMEAVNIRLKRSCTVPHAC